MSEAGAKTSLPKAEEGTLISVRHELVEELLLNTPVDRAGEVSVGGFTVKVKDVQSERWAVNCTKVLFKFADQHELFERACMVLNEVTGRPAFPSKHDVLYEVHRDGRLLGEARGYIVELKVEPLKEDRAVVEEWYGRLRREHPDIARYAYIAEEKGARTPYPVLVVKLVKPSRELEELLAQPAPREAKVAVEEAVVKPRREGLVKLYLLSMRLPSKYLVQKIEYGEYVEVRRFDAVASKIETLRRQAYRLIERVFAYVEELGVWIAVTEEAVEEARKVSRLVKDGLTRLGLKEHIDRYHVEAIPVYMEPEHARKLLGAAVTSLSKDEEALKARIEEAEKQGRARALQRLQRELEYKQRLLDSIKRLLGRL
jgi:hypothetical protein